MGSRCEPADAGFEAVATQPIAADPAAVACLDRAIGEEPEQSADAIDLWFHREAFWVADGGQAAAAAVVRDELGKDVEHVRRVRPARLRSRAGHSRVRVRLQDEELLREATGKSLHANADRDSITHFDKSAVGRLVEDRAVLLRVGFSIRDHADVRSRDVHYLNDTRDLLLDGEVAREQTIVRDPAGANSEKENDEASSSTVHKGDGRTAPGLPISPISTARTACLIRRGVGREAGRPTLARRARLPDTTRPGRPATMVRCGLRVHDGGGYASRRAQRDTRTGPIGSPYGSNPRPRHCLMWVWTWVRP